MKGHVEAWLSGDSCSQLVAASTTKGSLFSVANPSRRKQRRLHIDDGDTSVSVIGEATHKSAKIGGWIDAALIDRDRRIIRNDQTVNDKREMPVCSERSDDAVDVPRLGVAFHTTDRSAADK